MTKVLVVEDNAANMMLARDLLESRGYEVVEARTADDALDLAAANTFDLIIMDVQLPGTDGLEATRRLRSQTHTAHVPVLALTAHAMAGDRERAVEAGCTAYMSKPLRYREFLDTVGALVTGSPVTGSPVTGSHE